MHTSLYDVEDAVSCSFIVEGMLEKFITPSLLPPTYLIECKHFVMGVIDTNGNDVIGTGVWNFNADQMLDEMQIIGTQGRIISPVFWDKPVVVHHMAHPFLSTESSTPSNSSSSFVTTTLYNDIKNPQYVHMPLIQTIVHDIRHFIHMRSTNTTEKCTITCPSTGESACKSAWVLDNCIKSFYNKGG